MKKLLRLPAAIRRPATQPLQLDAQGDRITLDTAPDDPIAAAERALAVFGPMDVAALRVQARADDDVSAERRAQP